MIKIDFFKLSPRLGRVRYLGLFSFWLGLIIIMGSVHNVLNADHNDFIQAVFTMLLVFILVNIFFLKVRRLNDFDYSGWWALVLAIPIIGEIFFLIMVCYPGTAGDNRFGSTPSNPSLNDYLLLLTAPLITLVIFIISIIFHLFGINLVFFS